MKTVLLTTVLSGILGLAAVATLRAETPAAAAPTSQPAAATNTMCPVSGDAVDPKVTAVYNGKTYAFCCADCIKSFNKDPEKYASKAK